MKLIKPFCLWFTGLPCSGKTTLGNEISKRLSAEDIHAEMLDGDEIRKELSRDLGFSQKDRKLNNERIIYVSKLLVRNNVPAIVAFVSPFNEIREMARERIRNVIIVYVLTSLQECMRRDCRGLYKKALAGELREFTGIDSPFEDPISPEITIKTEYEKVDESADKIWKYLIKEGFIE
jgi:adenylylsulfate kinase